MAGMLVLGATVIRRPERRFTVVAYSQSEKRVRRAKDVVFDGAVEEFQIGLQQARLVTQVDAVER